LALGTCSHVLHNGPEPIAASGHTTYWGRITCARRNGKDHGVITELRVAADGPYVYVVVSERQTPPTEKAGQFEFAAPNGREASAIFMSQMVASAEFARSAVKICTAQTPDC
jgi:hypothetical protein